MERNGTKRNRIKSFATPAHSYEANQGHHQGRLAHRVRVDGVPNEATLASFSASRLGVNRAKQGQSGPVLTPLLRRPCAGGNFGHSPHQLLYVGGGVPNRDFTEVEWGAADRLTLGHQRPLFSEGRRTTPKQSPNSCLGQSSPHRARKGQYCIGGNHGARRNLHRH